MEDIDGWEDMSDSEDLEDSEGSTGLKEMELEGKTSQRQRLLTK